MFLYSQSARNIAPGCIFNIYIYIYNLIIVWLNFYIIRLFFLSLTVLIYFFRYIPSDPGLSLTRQIASGLKEVLSRQLSKYLSGKPH